MADQLKQIVSFVAVPGGSSATLAHNINSDGIAYVPDEAEVDNGDFQITAISSTSITVHNFGAGAATCDVLLQLWQSNTRALGPSTNVGNFAAGLTPRPFIGASSGGGGGVIATALAQTVTINALGSTIDDGAAWLAIKGVGTDSTQIGRLAVATGTGAVAIGTSTAVGANGVAIGNLANVASSGVAIGPGAISGQSGGTAIGRDAVTGPASQQAVAIGRGTSAAGSGAIAIGSFNTAAGGGGISIGNASAASGALSIAIGGTASAGFGAGIAMGDHASSTGASGVAIGDHSSASGDTALAFGGGATTGATTGAISIGNNSSQAAGVGIAIGTSCIGENLTAKIGHTGITKFKVSDNTIDFFEALQASVDIVAAGGAIGLFVCTKRGAVVAIEQVSVGAVGTGPGGVGRALYIAD